MLERLFPRVADNAYPGHRLAPWLLGLMTIKIAMGLNVMLNAPEVARSADGVPLETYGAPAAAAFAFMFAAWGLCQLILGLMVVVVLVRYRRLVPLMFLILLVEQGGRMLLREAWPLERAGSAPGGLINVVLTALMVVGLALSVSRGSGDAR